MSSLVDMLGNPIRDRRMVHLPVEFMRMLAIFVRNADAIGLGITCNGCKRALQGRNAASDNDWTMECECRTYTGANPLSDAVKRAAH